MVKEFLKVLRVSSEEELIAVYECYFDSIQQALLQWAPDEALSDWLLKHLDPLIEKVFWLKCKLGTDRQGKENPLISRLFSNLLLHKTLLGVQLDVSHAEKKLWIQYRHQCEYQSILRNLNNAISQVQDVLEHKLNHLKSREQYFKPRLVIGSSDETIHFDSAFFESLTDDEDEESAEEFSLCPEVEQPHFTETCYIADRNLEYSLAAKMHLLQQALNGPHSLKELLRKVERKQQQGRYRFLHKNDIQALIAYFDSILASRVIQPIAKYNKSRTLASVKEWLCDLSKRILGFQPQQLSTKGVLKRGFFRMSQAFYAAESKADRLDNLEMREALHNSSGFIQIFKI